MAKVTISYRRDDSMDITGRIFDRLTSHYGREAVFRDIDSIPPGLDFREHFRRTLDSSDILLVVVGPNWIGRDRKGKARIHDGTDNVRTEVEIALNRNMPIIPLLVSATEMPDPSELPESIQPFAYRHAVKIDSGPDFDHHMGGLIRAMDHILHRETPARSAASEGQPNLFLPVVGGVMTALGLMHIAWFTSYIVPALGAGTLGSRFMDVWSYADASFGIGGLIIGIGTIRGQYWARIAGIVLCLVASFSDILWFVESFDRDVSRLVLTGTGFATLLFILNFYLYVSRWPPAADSRPV